MTLERSVQTKALNDHLDSVIKRFLYHLSPYMLLKPTLKVIEWLVRRFRVHMYNATSLIWAVMPYHTTNIFVRVVQLCGKDGPSWLSAVCSEGVPMALRSITLLLANNPSILNGIFNTVHDAIAVHVEGGYAPMNTMVAFYLSTTLRLIDNGLTEQHLAYTVPQLARSFDSQFREYRLASYTIAGRLADLLVPRIAAKLVRKGLVANGSADAREVLMFAVASLRDADTEISRKLSDELASMPRVVTTIKDIASEHNVVPLLKVWLPVLCESGNFSLVRSLMVTIGGLESLISGFVVGLHDCYVATGAEETTKTFVKDVLYLLENRYPGQMEDAYSIIANERQNPEFLSLCTLGSKYVHGESGVAGCLDILTTLHDRILHQLAAVGRLKTITDDVDFINQTVSVRLLVEDDVNILDKLLDNVEHMQDVAAVVRPLKRVAAQFDELSEKCCSILLERGLHKMPGGFECAYAVARSLLKRAVLGMDESMVEENRTKSPGYALSLFMDTEAGSPAMALTRQLISVFGADPDVSAMQPSDHYSCMLDCLLLDNVTGTAGDALVARVMGAIPRLLAVVKSHVGAGDVSLSSLSVASGPLAVCSWSLGRILERLDKPVGTIGDVEKFVVVVNTIVEEACAPDDSACRRVFQIGMNVLMGNSLLLTDSLPLITRWAVSRTYSGGLTPLARVALLQVVRRKVPSSSWKVDPVTVVCLIAALADDLRQIRQVAVRLLSSAQDHYPVVGALVNAAEEIEMDLSAVFRIIPRIVNGALLAPEPLPKRRRKAPSSPSPMAVLILSRMPDVDGAIRLLLCKMFAGVKCGVACQLFEPLILASLENETDPVAEDIAKVALSYLDVSIASNLDVVSKCIRSEPLSRVALQLISVAAYSSLTDLQKRTIVDVLISGVTNGNEECLAKLVEVASKELYRELITFRKPESKVSQLTLRRKQKHDANETPDWTRLNVVLQALSRIMPLNGDVVSALYDVLEAIYKDHPSLLQLVLGILCASPGNPKNLATVVECVRESKDLQSRLAAVTLLSKVAVNSPVVVINNVVPIFTLMGNSLLRQDDEHTYLVLTQAIDSLTSILSGTHSLEILRLFADAAPFMPSHRRLKTLSHLIITMGTKDHLWQFVVMLVESRCLNSQELRLLDSPMVTADHTVSSLRVHVTHQILSQFDPRTVIECLNQLITYVAGLPEELDTSKAAIGVIDATTFNGVKFRKFKSQLCELVCHTLSCPSLVSGVTTSTDGVQEVLALLIETLLKFVSRLGALVSSTSGVSIERFWKHLQGRLYDAVEKANGLLGGGEFLGIFSALLASDDAGVRRKALDVFCTKLANFKHNFSLDLSPALFSILDQLTALISRDSEPDVNKQSGLIAMKLLNHSIGSVEPARLLQPLQSVIRLLEESGGVVAASAGLCAAECVSILGVSAVPFVNRLTPSLIGLLGDTTTELVMLSGLVSLTSVVKSLPQFLSPFIADLIKALHIIRTRSPDQIGQHSLLMKSDALLDAVASDVSPRVLIPILMTTAGDDVTTCCHVVAGILKSDDPGLKMLYSAVGELFLLLLLHRSRCLELVSEEPAVQYVEDTVAATLVTFVLKCSESTFRPFYCRFFEWATRDDELDKMVTFYRVSHRLSESLKSLFCLFSSIYTKHAANLLSRSDPAVSDRLLLPVVDCLNLSFKHDQDKQMDKRRFEQLLSPLIGQLQNCVSGQEEAYKDRTENHLADCIANFSVCSFDDAWRKQLVRQLLNCTRESNYLIRFASLFTLNRVHILLQESFLPLLPETIPFLAELLEDESESVEELCKAVIASLETSLGEPIRRYF